MFIYYTQLSFSKLSNNLPREGFQFFISFPNLNLSRVRKWDIQYADSLGCRLIRRSFQFMRSASTVFREHSLAPVLVSELFQQRLYLYTHCPFQNKQQLESRWLNSSHKPFFCTWSAPWCNSRIQEGSCILTVCWIEVWIIPAGCLFWKGQCVYK